MCVAMVTIESFVFDNFLKILSEIQLHGLFKEPYWWLSGNKKEIKIFF